MLSVVPYLLSRLLYRIWLAIYDWYAGGGRVIARTAVNALESLDRFWAVKITLRHLFEPLYQDRTMIGHILGFIFRSLRLILGGVLYLLIILAAVAAYAAWALVPPGIIYWGFKDILLL